MLDQYLDEPMSWLSYGFMVSSLLFVYNASPDTIIHFHAELINELPTIKGPWGFIFKIFRNNPFSIAPELAETHDVARDTKFLHTLGVSYLPGCCITLVNKRSVSVFSSFLAEDTDNGFDKKLAIPCSHLQLGATSGLNDPFDQVLTEKLQSLWNRRQIIRGDGGHIYELENGNLVIRTSNVFLHGTFKGFLIQMECDNHDPKIQIESFFRGIMSRYNMPSGRLCCDVLDSSMLDKYGDMCLQYSEILRF